MEAEDVLNLEYSFNDDKTIFGWTIPFNIAVVNTRTLFISQMQILHSIKVRKTCIWSTNAEERLLRCFLSSIYIFLPVCVQAKCFFSLAFSDLVRKKTNQSLIHYDGWLFVLPVSLSDSTRTASLSSIISVLFCFTVTLTKTDCETGAFRDTSYTSFKVLQLMLLFSEEFVVIWPFSGKMHLMGRADVTIDHHS